MTKDDGSVDDEKNGGSLLFRGVTSCSNQSSPHKQIRAEETALVPDSLVVALHTSWNVDVETDERDVINSVMTSP